MTDENVRIEKQIYSYHMSEICGIPAIYLTNPPIEGEPTCELIKRTRINDKIYLKQNYKIKLDYFKNLGYNINNERKE